MRNLRVEIAYDGGQFFGWQRQDGFETVQEALEDAIECQTGERVTVHGSGRTDTGVHALRQVANFHLASRLSDDRLCTGLNAHLPRSIAVNRLETCDDDFHARFSAVGKRYLYVASTTRFVPPTGESFSAWVRYSLDFRAMQVASRALLGTHDFRGLCSSGGKPTTTVRCVRQLRWIAHRDRLAFVIEADGFLYNMVRAIAGTLFDIGRGRLGVDCVREVLASGDRSAAGPTAAAGGLYLLRVRYPEPIFRAATSGLRRVPGIFGP